MSSHEENSTDRKKLLEELLKKADPALIEKFGNPLDPDDPRMWLPSTREEKGVSAEDRLRFLELDHEALSIAFANLSKGFAELYMWIRQQAEERLLEQVKNDPEGTLRKLLAGEVSIPGVTPEVKGSWGPLENREDASVRYAGSAENIQPHQMVETPDGFIRADQIPGYRNEPGWKPSPDWADANCMCPAHVAKREQAKNDGDDNPFTGLYL